MRGLVLVLVYLLAVTVGYAQDSAPKKQAKKEQPADLTSGGVYRIVNVLSGHALDVVDSSRNPGAALVQTEVSAKSQSQLWTVTKTNVGYKLINKNSGHALDVPLVRRQAGLQLIQWNEHGGQNQQWTIKKYAKGYGIGSLKSNLVLAVAGDARKTGAKVIQQKWAASHTQIWKFETVTKE